jgi:GntR family transcriptional regulator, transcriptional repressor for pyruvate dehydrogenase complex
VTTKAPAYQTLADDLRARILSGELKPGDRLPVEPELSAEFGVSRSTVREALRVLSSQNLVATTRGVSGGSFVVTPANDQISDYLATTVGLLTGTEQLSIRQLLEVRCLLEVPAAGLAARRRSAHHLAELADTILDPAAVGADELRRANDRFHTTLLAAAGNPLLEIVVRPVFWVINERFRREAAPTGAWESVEADHAAIYERVAAGDAEGASAAAQRHLDRLVPLYEQYDRAAAG